MEDGAKQLNPSSILDPPSSISRERLEAARNKALTELLANRAANGHWVGELSSSALSTATATVALAVAQKNSARSIPHSAIDRGLAWLAQHANSDGGWGDTTKSLSNISTTALCWAAFGAVPGADEKYGNIITNAERWLARKAGGTEPQRLAPAIIARYGKDRTFSVPILTTLALTDRLGESNHAWRCVLPLPFELAACPHQWFAALRLPVVSYALPALIAIGQARHFHLPTRNPVTRLARNLTRQPTLKILSRIQPSSGGFLEATPLTSFVVMSLAGSGQVNHSVTQKGLEFLLSAQRSDGSWPIDTNLATWLTTLAVNSIAGCEVNDAPRTTEHASRITAWLLAQQYHCEHPYTHAAPGGWAWTDLPGGVPDADDTAGAILALAKLHDPKLETQDPKLKSAALAGIEWLLGLQNTDGGIPTFCRGWGALPFDRSSADITAHAVRAWLAWLDELPPGLRKRTLSAVNRAISFLSRAQRSNGAWAALWFGNQFAPGEENLTYATARVLCALAQVVERAETKSPLAESLCHAGVGWLVKAQNAEGGWGGAAGIESSVEETALAVEALATAHESHVAEASAALHHGVTWLIERVESGAWKQPAPIGFYFARLWYFEKLYPQIFTVGALGRAAKLYSSKAARESRE